MRRLRLCLAVLAALTLFSQGAFAALAFVRASDLGNNGGSTNSQTAAFDATSCDELVVTVTGDVAAGADDITGVTYNAVSASLVVKQTGTGDRNLYEYHLEAPASGSHNVVVSSTGTHYLIVGASCYSGANSSGQADASNHVNQTIQNITFTVTTVTNNDWAVAVSETTGTAASNGTGLAASRTHDAAFNTWYLFDTGGVITPAGSYSMTISASVSVNFNVVVGAFKPAGAAAACVPTRALMGVGC